ncbi:hypothetical protein M231_00040 [Tremella mesenterica]|uniref:Bromo domain-containing protein n=1 Tax=Tremella mesenterica TaxID=5217 RepID=A0A4Q1BWM9_TREME|nr:hypothetical protein M231_00040 [Tremella mesenterica]
MTPTSGSQVGAIKLKLSLKSKTPAEPPTPSSAPPASNVNASASRTPVVAVSSNTSLTQNDHVNKGPGAIAGPSTSPAVVPSNENNLSSSKQTGIKMPQKAKHSRPTKAKPKLPLKPTAMPSPSAPTSNTKSSRPSAIPTRLLSSTPTTPRLPITTLPPDTPDQLRTTKDESPSVKIEFGNFVSDDHEQSPDPISFSHSVSPSRVPPETALSTPHAERQVTPTTAPLTSKSVNKWARLKKPLKELLSKIMIELRRRDEYDLFSLPVNLDIYTDYLDIVGGEDQIMDLGTMQMKVDEGEYTTMESFEADLKILVTAAQKYNAPNTIPHTAAIRLLQHGTKHIERSRPLIRTPSPSPDMDSGMVTREMTAMTDDPQVSMTNVSPHEYIPTEMLDFPPNSLEALAVGWNLTGGKRVWPKRIVRARERFAGKWRHWDFDGTRDLAEMDNVDKVMGISQSPLMGEVVDWTTMRREAWWEFEGFGGPQGQPPGFSPFPVREGMKRKKMNLLDVGTWSEVEVDIASLRQRAIAASTSAGQGKGGQNQVLDDDESLLSGYLRPSRGKGYRGMPGNFVNIYEPRPAAEYLREMCSGDTKGEAYLASIDRFVKGAIASRSPRHSDINTTSSPKSRRSSDSTKGEVEADGALTQSDEGSISLQEYIMTCWHSGILQSRETETVSSTISDLATLGKAALRHSIPHVPSRSGISFFDLVKSANAAHTRLSMRDFLAAQGSLDIGSMLKDPTDFSYQGIGAKTGVAAGLEWVTSTLSSLIAKRYPPPPPPLPIPQDKQLDQVEDEGNEKNGNEEEGKHATEDDINGMEDAEGKMELRRGKRKRPGSLAEPDRRKKLRPSISAESSPLSELPDESVKEKEAVEEKVEEEDDGEQGLKRLRLELVALSKFYPLAALRKMDKKDAERLLPPNVRTLLAR